MQISPPFGYRDITPFLKTHKLTLPPAGAVPAFTRSLNAIPVSYTEFNAASRDYPLVFASNDGGKTIAPVAVLGLEANENLFLDATAWVASTYVPAYVRRYPFCMARVTLDAVEQEQRLICVEKDFVAAAGEGGEPMFNEQAEALPRWAAIEQLLREYEADLERSAEMCGIFTGYGLIESFTMQATLNSGAAMSLTGMFRIDEKKLAALGADQLRTLISKGLMAKIYTHFMSLENFGRLLERKAARGVIQA